MTRVRIILSAARERSRAPAPTFRQAITYVLAMSLGLAFMVPFFWAFFSAFKDPYEIAYSRPSCSLRGGSRISSRSGPRCLLPSGP